MNLIKQRKNVRGQPSGSAGRVQFLMLTAIAVNQQHWPPNVRGEEMLKVPHVAQQLSCLMVNEMPLVQVHVVP